ncbi:glutamate receptor 1-like, partial [Tropilaelaps mercedesae]
CSILKNGTFAMVATTTASSYETLVSYSNTFQIPIVSPSFPYHTRLRPAKYGISMRPNYLQAILDLIQHYRWKQIVYIYDSDAGLLKLQNLYKLTTNEYKLEIIKVRRVISASEANKFLVNYDNETRDQLKHVVIDCEANLTREIIIKHIMDEFANNPAMEFGAVNITGFRLVQNNSRAYEEVFTEKSRHQWPDPKTKRITSEAALMYDGTRVMLGAFKQLLNEYPAIFAKNFRRGEVYNNNTRGIDCKREKIMPWEHGNEIFHRLRNVSG